MTNLKKAPSPEGHFLLGHLPAFNRDVLAFLEQSHRDHGDIVRIRLARRIVHVVSHPALAEQVLITNTDSMVKVSQVRPNVGLSLFMRRGLVVSYGDLWRHQRSLINPMFHPKAVEKQVESMILSAETLVSRLERYAAEKIPADIWSESLKTTLDAALRTLFGRTLTEDFDRLYSAFTEVLRYCFDSTKNPFFLAPKWPTPTNRRFRSAMAVIDNYVDSLIKDRLAEGIKRTDFLDLLLKATSGKTDHKMSVDLMRDEAVTMLAAGHETSAGALTSALFYIARHPEIARRIREELFNIVGDGPLNSGHLRQLRYLQAVVQETLRLAGPVALIPRAVATDSDINGYHVPAGTLVFVAVHNIHRHKDFWEEPERFNPDRFYKGDGVRQKHRCAYIPFGAGERFCIGSHFGSIELTILLAHVVRNFDFHLVRDTIPMEVAITTRPAGPVHMMVENVSTIKTNMAWA